MSGGFASKALLERQGAASRTIVIAGGGIAGLTSALCIARAGYRALVLEARAEPATEGAGIQVSPNAYFVLSQLGLSRVLWASGFAPQNVVVQSGATGDTLSTLPLGSTFRERYDAPYLVLHRADLLNALIGACANNPDIDIRHNIQVQDLAVHQNGVTVLGLEQGRMGEFRGRSVIGADGAFSRLRDHVPGAVGPSFSGDIAWRALLDRETVAEWASFDDTVLQTGPNAHLVTYPVRGGALLNVVAITKWRGETPPAGGWLSGIADDERISAFAGWNPKAMKLIEADAGWGAWPLFEAKKVARCFEGPLCLIGDAAHAMLPYAAQGGASSIEDAYVLGKCLEGHPDNHERAFAAFWKARKRRWRRLLDLARSNQRVYHLSGPMQEIRDFAMRKLPQSYLARRMDWVYSWRAD